MHFVLTLICLISFTLVQLVSGAHPSDSPLACVIFFSAAVLQIAAVFYGLNRARRNTRSSSGSQPPEPTVATAVLFKAPNPDDRQSKLQSIENCGPMMSFSTTTSATVSSNASNGIFNAMKNAITGTAAPAAADGAYSALGTEESVHSSHQKSVVIVGTPIGTHQQSTTNWI